MIIIGYLLNGILPRLSLASFKDENFLFIFLGFFSSDSAAKSTAVLLIIIYLSLIAEPIKCTFPLLAQIYIRLGIIILLTSIIVYIIQVIQQLITDRLFSQV